MTIRLGLYRSKPSDPHSLVCELDSSAPADDAAELAEAALDAINDAREQDRKVVKFRAYRVVFDAMEAYMRGIPDLSNERTAPVTLYGVPVEIVGDQP